MRKKPNGRCICQSTAIARFVKEQKASDLSEKVELVKWVKNAGEGEGANVIR